jgi:hypothetical protein
VNLFLYNLSAPISLEDDIECLHSVHLEIRSLIHSISMEDAIQKTGAYFPCRLSLLRDQIRGRNIVTMRLYIPLIDKADWFFYMDDDAAFRCGQFSPEVMRFTTDKSKILFAEEDHPFMVSRVSTSHLGVSKQLPGDTIL